MFQAQAVTLTVAQAFKVAFEFWQVSKEGESCLRTLWVGSGIEQAVEEGWQSAMGWGGEAKAQESGLDWLPAPSLPWSDFGQVPSPP